MKRTLREKLFSISKSPYRTVVRFLFLKFTFKDRELDPKRLCRTPECEYPRLLKKWYGKMMDETLDLDRPRTFNHKLQWIKLYGDRELMTRLADKLAVRDYVAERIGERFLTPLVGAYADASEIDWNALPSRFVLKPNHGSHWLEIIEDKTTVDRAALFRRANSWLSRDYSFDHGFELHYGKIKPRLMIERHLGDYTDDLRDYKVWCFHGVPRFIQVSEDRFSQKGFQTAFYSPEWKKQIFWKGQLADDVVPRPAALADMLACASKLSADIPFVRVDFYCMDDGSLKFGEMTFTPCSGMSRWRGSPTIDRELGDLIHLPCDERKGL